MNEYLSYPTLPNPLVIMMEMISIHLSKLNRKNIVFMSIISKKKKDAKKMEEWLAKAQS